MQTDLDIASSSTLNTKYNRRRRFHFSGRTREELLLVYRSRSDARRQVHRTLWEACFLFNQGRCSFFSFHTLPGQQTVRIITNFLLCLVWLQYVPLHLVLFLPVASFCHFLFFKCMCLQCLHTYCTSFKLLIFKKRKKNNLNSLTNYFPVAFSYFSIYFSILIYKLQKEITRFEVPKRRIKYFDLKSTIFRANCIIAIMQCCT